MSGRVIAPGPVRIGWDGADRTIATAVADAGGAFEAPIRIPTGVPDGTPGYHYVIVTGSSTNPAHDTNHNSAVTPFCVTGRGVRCDAAGTTSRRARAISRCKRRYRGGSRSAKKKRAACIRRAKRRYRA